MAYAANLVAGQHEVRRPGESEWLPVENVDLRRNVDPPEVFLTAGGRDFHTLAQTLWPARMAVGS